jgi:hypothetical protein
MQLHDLVHREKVAKTFPSVGAVTVRRRAETLGAASLWATIRFFSWLALVAALAINCPAPSAAQADEATFRVVNVARNEVFEYSRIPDVGI